MGKKPVFGGQVISFEGRTETVEQVFGSAPLGPHEMIKKLWAYVKRRGLARKS
jgi:hypothetical protein